MTDTLYKNVRALVKQMQGLARQAHAEYSREVEAVIVSGSRDPQRIERLLDGILDFCFDPEMLQLFKKLCRHYYAIDPAATARYVYAYRDMWDSEYKANQPAPAKTPSKKAIVKTKKPRGKKGGVI